MIEEVERRDFIQGTIGLLAGAATATAIVQSAHAQSAPNMRASY
jgi:hypothetical protein